MNRPPEGENVLGSEGHYEGKVEAVLFLFS
jgi:hypothetical protein